MKYKLKYKTQPDGLQELLKMRGITNITEFVSPTSDNYIDPLLLDNMEEGYLCYKKHLLNDDVIDLVVDSDCDGITSSAIFYNATKIFRPSAEIRYYLHDGKQHGLEDQIEKLLSTETYLVVCPDSASNDYAQHAQLKENGTDVLVLDHHECDEYSNSAIVINNQMSQNYKNKGLSGATVTYKFVCYCAQRLYEEGWDFDIQKIYNMIDIAAVGAIGDMMDVTTLENRFLFKQGLANINNFGLRTLVDKQAFSLGDLSRLNPMGIAFYIVPLINAMIRVGSAAEKEILFRSFIEGDTVVQSTKRGAKVGQMETIAVQNARNCTNAKARQKRSEDKALEYLQMVIERDGLDEHKILLIEVDDEKQVDPTITGLIAMKVMNVYHKPVLLGRKNDEGYIKGSIRNDDKSELKDLKAFLEESRCFEYIQGHANAAGFSIHENYVDRFLSYADEKLKDIDFNEGVYSVDFIFGPDIEGTTPQNPFGNELFKSIDYSKEFWGQGFPEPLLVIENLPIDASEVQIMGKTSDTIKITHNGIEYIKFRATDLIKEVSQKKSFTITLMGTAHINEFGGRMTPQLTIKDYQLRSELLEF